jgi:hypothetical protein
MSWGELKLLYPSFDLLCRYLKICLLNTYMPSAYGCSRLKVCFSINSLILMALYYFYQCFWLESFAISLCLFLHVFFRVAIIPIITQLFFDLIRLYSRIYPLPSILKDCLRTRPRSISPAQCVIQPQEESHLFISFYLLQT